MRFKYKLPKLAETAENYVTIEWNVSVGQTVSPTDPLIVVEKVQVDSPFGGTVVELLADKGDEVLAGQAICVIEGDL